METKTVLNKEEASNYIKEYFELSGHTIKPDYFSQAKIRAFFGDDGVMIGGYCINHQAPYRYSMLISEQVFADALLKYKIDAHSLIEVTGVWISRKASVPQIVNIYDWLAIDSIVLNKKYIIAASTEEKIANYFQKAMPNLLYNGTPFGAPNFNNIWMYGTPTFLFRQKIWFELSLLLPKMCFKYLSRQRYFSKSQERL